MTHWRLLIVWLVCVCSGLHFSSAVSADIEIVATGLFKGSALLVINGKQQLLKVGKTSPEGVTVVAADSKRVIVSYQGEEKELTVSRQIGTLFATPSNAEVRIASGKGGHYWANGLINGHQVSMMVDTGATSVAMSERQAKLIGVRYLQGVVGMANTAGGNVKAWQVRLDSVSVGNVVVNQVAAVVLEGDFPEMVLLGNSFLGKVDLDREQGVLLLRSRF